VKKCKLSSVIIAEGKLLPASSALIHQSTRFLFARAYVPPTFVIAACKRSVRAAVTG
jgi:hypothetical protein